MISNKIIIMMINNIKISCHVLVHKFSLQCVNMSLNYPFEVMDYIPCSFARWSILQVKSFCSLLNIDWNLFIIIVSIFGYLYFVVLGQWILWNKKNSEKEQICWIVLHPVWFKFYLLSLFFRYYETKYLNSTVK